MKYIFTTVIGGQGDGANEEFAMMASAEAPFLLGAWNTILCTMRAERDQWSFSAPRPLYIGVGALVGGGLLMG